MPDISGQDGPRPTMLIMDNDHLVLSALQPDTVASRLESREAPEAEEDEE